MNGAIFDVAAPNKSFSEESPLPREDSVPRVEYGAWDYRLANADAML